LHIAVKHPCIYVIYQHHLGINKRVPILREWLAHPLPRRFNPGRSAFGSRHKDLQLSIPVDASLPFGSRYYSRGTGRPIRAAADIWLLSISLQFTAMNLHVRFCQRVHKITNMNLFHQISAGKGKLKSSILVPAAQVIPSAPLSWWWESGMRIALMSRR